MIISRSSEAHTVKFGANIFATFQTDVNETFFGGRFNFGAAIPLANIIALNPGLPSTTLAQLQTFLASNNAGLLPSLAQPINALQSYNLNLPIVYQQGFGADTISGPNYKTGYYAQDTWKIKRNFELQDAGKLSSKFSD